MRLRVLAITSALALASPGPALAGPTVVGGPSAPTPATTAIAPQPTPAASPAPGRVPDPLAALGAGSPSCRGAVSTPARRNCTQSGSIAHAYPLSSYGIDVQIGFSLTHMEQSFLGALQSVAALLWMALVFLVKGVLLLLEWAFSIDLLGVAMRGVQQTLTTLHDRVIGEPWFLAALAVAGVWGIWRGLVQRQTGATIGGLAATVALMIMGLVVLGDPAGTVGYASKLSNDAALGILGAATSQDVDRPTASLSDAMIGVFDDVVRDPWCALEFGSVDWCHAHAQGTSRITNADVWLAYPAGSGERQALYKLLKGEDPDGGGGLLDFLATPAKPLLHLIGIGGGKSPHVPDAVRALVAKQPERAAMQEAGGTFSRFALLALIGVGVTGAVALLAYLGIRLLLAAVLSLLLLLLAPAMLLAPAFGESGRATFIAWARRLVGALAAKLIYALFLAIVLAASGMLTRLGIGWFGTWLLQIAFWWGVLLKRHELIGFVSAGTPAGPTTDRASSMLARGYYAMQLGRTAVRGAGGAGAVARLAGSASRRRRSEHELARRAAVGELARQELDAAGTRVLTGEHAEAHTVLTHRQQLERELRAVDRRLAGFDEAKATARARDVTAPAPTEEQSALLAHRERLQELLASPQVRIAEQLVSHAERTRARTGTPVADADLAAWRRQRADAAAGLPIDHEHNLRAAGIEPDRFQSASEQERDEMRADVRSWLERERELLRAAEPEADSIALARAARHMGKAEIRARTAQEHARLRRERQQRRARANVFRPR